MADPYRDVAAGDQLAAQKALPAPMMNRVLAALMLYRAWPFAVFVPPQTKESIEGAGMRYLGNRVEAVLVPMTSQVWTDREQTTQVSASHRGYWMCTYFESGSCILTWDHVPNTQPNEHLEVYGTEESFTLDYEAHLRAVKRKRDAGEVDPTTLSSPRVCLSVPQLSRDVRTPKVGAYASNRAVD